MSNLYNAIQKGSGELAEAMLASFGEEAPVAGQVIALVPAEAAPPALMEHPEPMNLPVGPLPIRIGASSPSSSASSRESLLVDPLQVRTGTSSPTSSVPSRENLPVDPVLIRKGASFRASSAPSHVSLPVDPPQIRRLPVHLQGKSPLLPFGTATSAAAEQYRLIRTRLLQHPRQPRMLLVSSTGPGDGKSVTAVNIAGALSLKSEAKVLLADMDFRRGVLHTRLGLPVCPGIGDILIGTATLEESLVNIEQLPNLYFLPSGERQSNPSELLDSEPWASLCNRLRGEFRYIVADAPPVASVADYELLQASCDGVVMVARPDYTRREACIRTLKLVPKEKFIGVVMNDVSDWFFTRSTHYSSYYSYYHRTDGV